jgi:hypothetical protein
VEGSGRSLTEVLSDIYIEKLRGNHQRFSGYGASPSCFQYETGELPTRLRLSRHQIHRPNSRRVDDNGHGTETKYSDHSNDDDVVMMGIIMKLKIMRRPLIITKTMRQV